MKFSKEFRIGVFVISVLITSFFVINYLRGKDLFNREMEVISYFDEVDGLNVSAPVFKSLTRVSSKYLTTLLLVPLELKVPKTSWLLLNI